MKKRSNSSTAYAKRKVRSHLEKKRGVIIDITVEKIEHWFHVINRAVFGGDLMVPDFEYGRTRKCYGYMLMSPDTKVLKISDRIKTVELFLATLAHEMVHLWQYMNENIPDMSKKVWHGKSFIQWKAYFKDHIGIII